jgi:hypothetical protein
VLKVLDSSIDILKLGIPIRVMGAFLRFAIALQTIARCAQKPPHRTGTHRMMSTSESNGVFPNLCEKQGITCAWISSTSVTSYWVTNT